MFSLCVKIGRCFKVCSSKTERNLNNKYLLKIHAEQYQRDLKGTKNCYDQSGHMLSSKHYQNVMFNISLSVCACVCVKGQKGHNSQKVSQTHLPDRAQPDSKRKHLADIFAVLSLNGTGSNNSEHLGSLQALHPSPWGSSPGTGGCMQLPFPHKSCLEQIDYHSSPKRDRRTGILSNYFTLIIRIEWQPGQNTDTYLGCIKKSTVSKLKVENKVTFVTQNKTNQTTQACKNTICSNTHLCVLNSF